MTDREKVLAKWPEAICIRSDHAKYPLNCCIVCSSGQVILSIWCTDESAAWADAAARQEEKQNG